MTRLRTLALATPLLVAALGLAAARQDSPKTPSTPRQILERAYYSEEHEHDLAAAEKGYRDALAAANGAKDAAVAAEADAALKKVLVRQGQAAAASKDELPQAVIVLLVAAQSVDPASDDAKRILDDLSLFGSTAVPTLAKMLTSTRGAKVAVGSVFLEAQPLFAARALGAIDGPESRRALEQAFATSDPVLRREIVRWSRGDHLELALLASADPVEAVRRLASQRLMASRDARAIEPIQREARRGDGNAIQWLARERPGSLVDLMAKDELRDVNPDTLRFAFSSSSWFGAGAADLKRLAELCANPRRAEDRDVVRAAMRRLLDTQRSQGSQPSQRGLYTDELEDAIVATAVATREPVLIERLSEIGSTKRFQALKRIVSTSEGELDMPLLQALSHSLGRAESVSNVPLSDLLELFDALATRSPIGDDNVLTPSRLLVTLIRMRSLEANEPAKFVELARKLGEEQRVAYASEADHWAAGVCLRQGRERPLRASVFPKDHAVVAEWLLTRPETKFQDRGLELLSGVEGVDVLKRSLDVLETKPGLVERTSAAQPILSDLAARAPEATLEQIYARLSRLARDPAKLDRAEGFATITRLVPLDTGSALLRRAWTDALADVVRSEMYRSWLNRWFDETAPPELLQAILELYPGLPASETWSRKKSIAAIHAALYEPGIPLLGQALADSDAGIREAAQEAFAAFRKQREAIDEFNSWMQTSKDQRTSIDELKALLASPSRDVVLGAVKALGAVRARTALPELVKLLARDDAALKQAVQEAIDKIGQ